MALSLAEHLLNSLDKLYVASRIQQAGTHKYRPAAAVSSQGYVQDPSHQFNTVVWNTQ